MLYRIGPRKDFGCANIITSTGLTLPWVREIRYLGSYLTAGRQFRIPLVTQNVLFIEPQMLFLGKSVDLFPKKC